MPTLCGVETDIDLEFELGCSEGILSDDAHSKMTIYMDHTSWKYLLSKKHLNPLYLNYFILSQEFEFKARDKEAQHVVEFPFFRALSLVKG